jgi:hypothetical protein
MPLATTEPFGRAANSVLADEHAVRAEVAVDIVGAYPDSAVVRAAFDLGPWRSAGRAPIRGERG